MTNENNKTRKTTSTATKKTGASTSKGTTSKAAINGQLDTNGHGDVSTSADYNSDFIDLDDLVYAPLHALAQSNEQLKCHVLGAIRQMGTLQKKDKEDIIKLNNLNVAYADCTILVFMDGSDLENNNGIASAELQEMQDAFGQSEDMTDKRINIVVEAGGTPNWYYTLIEGNTYSRFRMTANGVEDIEFMDTRNMGRANTLSEFIDYGVKRYPAKHYGLIFWNHGAGPLAGFGCDLNYNHDTLTLPEIKSAIEASEFEDKFSFIAFDACDMACFEMAETLYPFTDYLIASEDIMPEDGFDYGFLQNLPMALETEDEDKISWKMSNTILDSYEAYYTDRHMQAELSMIDMSEYKVLETEFCNLLDKINAKDYNTFFRNVEKRRNELSGLNIRKCNDVSDLVDMGEFLDLAVQISGESEIGNRLKEAYGKLLPRVITVGDKTGLSGMSIFLPAGKKITSYDDYEIHKDIGGIENYQIFIENYRKFIEEKVEIDWEEPAVMNDQIRARVDKNCMKNIAAVYLDSYCLTRNGTIAYVISSDTDVAIDNNGLIKAKTSRTFWGLDGMVLSLFEWFKQKGVTLKIEIQGSAFYM